MNLPNVLTMSRLIMAVILLFLLSVSFPFSKTVALIVFAVAGLTDYLDGYLARNVYGETAFGSLMDPLADKVIVCVAFVSFVEIQLPGRGSLVPAWIAVTIIAREFLVTGLRLLALNKGKVISAGRWGKHKTVWQIVAIVVLLIGLALRADLLPHVYPSGQGGFDLHFSFVADVVAWAVGLITVVSGGTYFYQHRDLILTQMTA